jgi:hypothetical protein
MRWSTVFVAISKSIKSTRLFIVVGVMKDVDTILAVDIRLGYVA